MKGHVEASQGRVSTGPHSVEHGVCYSSRITESAFGSEGFPIHRRKLTYRQALIYLVVLIIACSGLWSRQAVQAKHEIGTTAVEPILSHDNMISGQAAVMHLKETGQYESLLQAIDQARYTIRPFEQKDHMVSDSLWAQNSAHGFNSIFTPSGLQLNIRTGQDAHSAEYISKWQLVRLGYGDIQQVVPPGLLRSTGQGVELVRPTVTEWFKNKPSGLEHGFTIFERPAANPDRVPLQLALSVTGDLTPRVDINGEEIHLNNDAAEQVLAYDGLRVWDADGILQDARLTNIGNQVLLYVEDAKARYPLTIDPTFNQQAYLKASNSESDDLFGWSLAISNDTVVVGVPREDSNATGVNGDSSNNSADGSGAAYVFVRTGTTWSEQAYLKASNTEQNDSFGWSVAISGDSVIVGAPQEDSNAAGVNGDESNNSLTNTGAAYVFVRSGTSWSQQAYLKASNPGLGDEFGISVAISGNSVVVGAFRESGNATGVNGNESNNSASRSGAAYVFERSGTSWSQQAYLKASNTEANDEFGYAVAISGDSVVVGARNEDSDAIGINGNESNNSASNSGAAYVFERSGTSWSQQAYLKAGNTGPGDRFSESVAISGDTVAVGASAEASNATGINGDGSNNSAFGSGAVYIFVRNGTSWSQQAYLKASNAEQADRFGWTVSISGDSVVVGTPSEDSNATGVNGDENNNSAQGSGAAYVFMRSGTNWSQQAYIKASNATAGDDFGRVVAISGDTVVVGAIQEDSNATTVNGDCSDDGANNSGSVYIFSSSGGADTNCNPDSDGDGVDDDLDNCPMDANPGQEDNDSDSLGDVCDPDDDNDSIPDNDGSGTVDNGPFMANTDQNDNDNDGAGDACDADDDNDAVLDIDDNCHLDANTDQANNDGDNLGDVCDPDDDDDGIPDDDGAGSGDNCPFTPNLSQDDTDSDGAGDACDADDDGDGVDDADSYGNPLDNCGLVPNADQTDTDGDGVGNACSDDDDADGHDDNVDNCPVNANPSQANSDGDGDGDACDDDDDNDTVLDDFDNCPFTDNLDQDDNDEDGVGDACDADDDNDGVDDGSDNCSLIENPDQLDTDGDTQGNACDDDDDGDGVNDVDDNGGPLDNCSLDANPLQEDLDGDGAGNACDDDDDDNCSHIVNPGQEDADSDGDGNLCDVDDDDDGIEDLDLNGDPLDNCPLNSNPDQADLDSDGIGDACDGDDDGDGVDDGADNCTFIANPDQANLDGDGQGDACDADDDGDGVDEVDASGTPVDNCPVNANPDQVDTDGDGAGDACDADDDGDGVNDADDNCALTANADQADADEDGIGDLCDDDVDGDGVNNDVDNCATIPNSNQDDLDEDGIGDVCDADVDGDGVDNVDSNGNPLDNCVYVANPDQEDTDGDGIGDACATPVPVDIRPNVCKNYIYTQKGGLLRVSVLGTETLDVTQIDVDSIRLAGVAPRRASYADKATPFEPYLGKSDPHDCNDDGPDGHPDLNLKFKNRKIVNALGHVRRGDVLVLPLTGYLLDGTPIIGQDVIVVIKPRRFRYYHWFGWHGYGGWWSWGSPGNIYAAAAEMSLAEPVIIEEDDGVIFDDGTTVRKGATELQPQIYLPLLIRE